MRLFTLFVTALTIILLAGCGDSDTTSQSPLFLPEYAQKYFDEKQAEQKKIWELNREKVKALLDSGININAMDERGQSLLHLAAWYGDIEGARYLLDQGAQADIQVLPAQITPLRLVAEKGNVEMAKLLLKYGADVNLKDAQKYAPLHRAAVQGHREMVELLLASGAKVDCRESKLCTPLYFAVANEHEDVVKVLLDHGAQANIKDKGGYTPMHEAAVHNNVEIAKLLMAKGVDINAANKEGLTPLHMAARGEKIEVVKQEDGAGKNKIRECSEIAELLIERGANVNSQDIRGRTPLDWADFDVHDKVGDILRKHGAKSRLELKTEQKND